VEWTKGAGPCARDEAERRINDPSHPWYRKGPLRRADTHKAMNALIQGSAARHTKLWMRAVWREGIVPLLQMHDCLDLSVSSPEQAERVAQLGREAVRLEVPIEVDLKYGRTWGDAKHTWTELCNGIHSGVEAARSEICLPNTETLPRQESEPTQPQNIDTETPWHEDQNQPAAEPEDNRDGGDGYPHGERETGQQVAFFVYHHADGRPYLGVKKTASKQFPQYHWTGASWAKGAPAGLKIPYRLPQLLKAPLDAWILICAGEKDADTAAALGFIATTNPEGERKGAWAPELNAWLSSPATSSR
jgi:hypothetical protein